MTLRLALLALACQLATAHADTRVIEADPHLHLVCDDRVIARSTGLALVAGHVEKDAHNPVFKADKLWENALNNLYPNVHFDSATQTFHLWYKCLLNDPAIIAKLTPVRTIHDQGWLLLHATSQDGIAWQKPDHGIVEFDGNTHNNAVARDTPNVGVFHDLHDPDPTRRYKMVFDTGLGELQARFSPDGLHWAEPIKLQGFSARNGDTHTNAFYDEASQRYVLYTKLYLGERLQARFESRDFIHWTGGDLAIRSTLAEGRSSQTYCIEVFPYGSGYLGWVMMYNVGKGRTVDCELAWSPDNKTWRRLFPGQGFIPRGPAGSYDSLCIYGPASKAIVQDGQHYILYGGSDISHLGWKRHCLPCVAQVREDRLVGLQAEAQGECLTQPLLATGEPLKISADAAGGSIRVAVLDEPGFEESEAITSDVTRGEVRWPKADFTKLKGKQVRLRFTLQHATLHTLSGLAHDPAFLAERASKKEPIRPRDTTPYTGPHVAFTSSFDKDNEGWIAVDKAEHQASGGAPGGYLSITRAGRQPYAFAPLDKAFAGKLQGDWTTLFKGAPVKLSFAQRTTTPGAHALLEIWANDVAQWTYDKLPPATTEWSTVSLTIRTDWSDAEAQAAGWRKSTSTFPWQETMQHVGKLTAGPFISTPGGSFDLDEVRVETNIE